MTDQLQPNGLPTRPRVWTVLVAFGAVLPATVVASLLVLYPASLIAGMDLIPSDGRDGFLETAAGVVLAIVVSQLVFGSGALLPAFLSPMPLLQRLGLERSPLSGVTLAALVGGVLVIPMPLEILFALLGIEPSEALEKLGRMLSDQEGLAGLAILLVASIGPGVCEELFFRGYIQQRLQRAWPPALGIGLTSVLFAAAHIDPMHATLVLPIGVYLGWMAWKARSILPCICAHALLNGTSVGLSQWTDLGSDPEAGISYLTIVMWSISALSLAYGLYRMRHVDLRSR